MEDIEGEYWRMILKPTEEVEISFSSFFLYSVYRFDFICL